MRMWNEPMEPLIALGLPIGLLLCGWGARFVRWSVCAAAFLGAGLAAGGLAEAAGAGAPWALAAGAAGGLAGAVLFRYLFRIGVFVLGAAGGLLLGGATSGPWRPGLPSAVWAGALAVSGGVLALWTRGVALALLTSVVGAWLATASVLHFAAGLDLIGEVGSWDRLPSTWALPALLAWAALAMGGAIRQLGAGVKG